MRDFQEAAQAVVDRAQQNLILAQAHVASERAAVADRHHGAVLDGDDSRVRGGVDRGGQACATRANDDDVFDGAVTIH